MITAIEIAALGLFLKDLKSRAKSLRSTASSIRSEVEFAAARQLSDRDAASLANAADILSKLANHYAEAATLQGKKLDAQQARHAAALKYIQGTFGKLQCDDLQALAWATDGETGIRRLVREGKVDLPDLLGTLACRASDRAKDEVEAEEKARAVWRKFEEGRGRYLKEGTFMAEVVRAEPN